MKMDSSLQKNQIEDHLRSISSDSDSDEETCGKSFQSPRKVKENRSQSKNQELIQSRKRRADSVDESKPAKINRNTPTKNNPGNVPGLPICFSPGQRSSPRNTKRQIFEAQNKSNLSGSPIKLSAKKNLFASKAQQNDPLVSCTKVEIKGRAKSNPKDEDQTSSEESDETFESAAKSTKKHIEGFMRTYKKLKPSRSELYSVKSPSKTSPMKVTIVKNSPFRKTKPNVDSPAKCNVSSTISKRRQEANDEEDSECEKLENDHRFSPRKLQSSLRTKCSNLKISKCSHTNEIVTSPKTSKHLTNPQESRIEISKDNTSSPAESGNASLRLDNTFSPKKLLSKANTKVESDSDSEKSENYKSDTPSKSFKDKGNKPKRTNRELMYLNIDMNECVVSTKTSKRMTARKSYFEDSTDDQDTSSKESVIHKSSSKECKCLSEVKASKSDKVKLIMDAVKADLDKEASTPQKTRRSSVTFSPLPPKHRPTRTPRKVNSDLSEEDIPQEKSSSKARLRKSLRDIKENVPEILDHVTPTKQKGTRSGKSCTKYDEDADDQDQCSTPVQRKSISVTTPVSKKGVGRGFLTPSMARKATNSRTRDEDALDATRKQLHISTIPKSLPCRDSEFSQIKSFLARKIEHLSGGCMYISGVPGTGKTATVHAVVRSLQEDVGSGDLSDFDFVEVNGLRLTEPKQAYVRIYQALTDKKLTPDQAQQLLSRKFSGNCKKSTIILVDELDYLCNRRQDVVYNILDWPTKRNSALVVLTISNTMDLAERTLKGRVTSRMGLTRVTFQPYSHHQLQEIVLDRLCGSEAFHPDAVQLVARKVAAVSGDARRALDICRRTTELVSSGEQVTAAHVQQALMQIFSGPRVLVIQQLPGLCQLALRSLRDVSHATGIEESTVAQLYKHLEQICVLENLPLPTVGAVLQTCVSLVNLGLIVAEKGRHDLNRKLSLNVSSDDIHYALDNGGHSTGNKRGISAENNSFRERLSAFLPEMNILISENDYLSLYQEQLSEFLQ